MNKSTSKKELLNKKLTFTVDNESAKRLEDLARSEGVSVAWVLRKAVKNYLRENPDQQSLLDKIT